jgi:hypothetical protein
MTFLLFYDTAERTLTATELPPRNPHQLLPKGAYQPGKIMDKRTSQYSEEQVIGFLRQAAAGIAIKGIGRKQASCDASFYKWRSK